MNPKISITVDAKNKAVATLTGMVTVGAKVDVEIVGLPSGIPDWSATDRFAGKSVRFRVVDEAGHDLVRFPLVEKTTQADNDKWTVVSAVGSTPETYKTNDGTANTPEVDFNTDGLRREMCGVSFNDYCEFGLIIDSIVDKAQYAVGRIKIRQWSVASSDDPTVLPDWRDTLAKLTVDLASVEASKTAAAASAVSAGQSASLASQSASAASQSANSALGHENGAIAAKNAAESASTTAQTAASHYPYVDANGHWKVWENSAWVDKGAAKGDKGDTGEVDKVLEGETMKISPSQRQMTDALKKIWQALGGTFTMCFMLAACVFGDVTRDTEWQDVPPETRLGTVVDLYDGGRGGMTTNDVRSVSATVITNHVDNGYLCSVSSAEAMTNALGLALASHVGNTGNPHGVTAAQVGAYTKGETDGLFLKTNVWNRIDETFALVKKNDSYRLLYWDENDNIWTSRFHTYWEHIKSTPTTLSGYGITDAKIENGNTVTLGSSSVRFLPVDSTSGRVQGPVSIQGNIEVLGSFSSSGSLSAIGVENNDTPVVYGITTNGTDYLHADVNLSGLAQKADIEPMAGMVATNVVGEVLDYALVQLSSASVNLASGQIGNLSLTSEQTSLTVNLNFSNASDRSGDCMLYLINKADTELSVGPAGSVTPIGYTASDAMKAGTNLVMFTRLAYDENKSVVNVSIKEVK